MTGVVRRHVRWVDEHREPARLLLSTPPAVLRRAVGGPGVEANRRFFAAVTT